MKNAIIAATAAALIAGSAATYAANTQGGPDGPGRWHPSAEDRAILTDARIAALKTGLKLNAEQEKLWPQVASTLEEVSKNRQARQETAREARQANKGKMPDPIVRMRSTADRMDAAADDLRKIADASEPLYKTLDESQKERLQLMIRQNFRGMKPHGGGWRHG